MPAPQINVTIGTAGHIDHGKTALVKSLTGCDTDRLKEEKERGMSIDLGFAPCTIADLEVGIVDVPGHENFVKTMVAGAAGMDAVLLVVAADDGVMPQTREHLDILTLLGVQHGFVALTKIDRVEPDSRELVRADIRQFVQGTFLEGAPIVPVSNVTGEGFDGFYESLAELVHRVRPKSPDGIFRLPLDRAFSVAGYGTVVSGIPLCGSARVDDEVVLLPQETRGRIRGIEVYGRPSDVVVAGQCAAINVRHLEHGDIHRGDTLTLPDCFRAETWFACTLRLLRHDKLVLPNGVKVKFHTGTSEVGASLYALQSDQMAAGEEHLVQLRTVTPVVAGPGDRFIVRTLSPVRTVGGGMIIESISGKLRRTRPQVCDDLQERARAVDDDTRFVEYCVKTAHSLATRDAEIAFRTKLPLARVQEVLQQLAVLGRVISLGSRLYLHRDTAEETCRRIRALIDDFHRQSPESPGMTWEQLRSAAALDHDVLDGVVALLRAEGRVVEQKGRWASPEHRATFGDQDRELLNRVESLFQQQAFAPPSLEAIAEQTGLALDGIRRAVRILCEHQRLIKVEEGLLFHSEAVARAREILTDFLRREGRLESVKFKYLLDTSRKYAIPLLDYFDRVGVTRRAGNTRFLK